MQLLSTLPSRWALLLYSFLLWNASTIRQCHANGPIDIDGRHSFSLSTFDPSGRLGQVYHASSAASLGPPIVFVCRPEDGILMASPQVLPSPLIQDDGTARFARITSQILAAHSGLSADGRLLVAAAQRMAIEHEYVYDEPIPIDIFLEEISLLFQEYTMKAASRPFGVTLVVAYLPDGSTKEENPPQVYRVDPSGSVESLGHYGVINGDKMQTDYNLLTQLKEQAENSEQVPLKQGRIVLINTLKEALHKASQVVLSRESQPPEVGEGDDILPSNLRRILTANLSYKEGMKMDRYEV